MKDAQRNNAPGATQNPSDQSAFLGNIVETAIVTADCQRTMAGLVKLGIGPWRVHTFNADNVENQTYYGRPAAFELKVCFAESANMI